MDKTTIRLLVISIALEVVGWGLNLTGKVIPIIGWILVGGGGISLFLMIRYLIKEKYESLSSIEMQQEIKHRKKYLPDVKKYIEEMINRVEFLSNDSRLYDIEEYRTEYPVIGWQFRKIAKSFGEKAALEEHLWLKRVYSDNLLFRKIQEEDNVLSEIISKLDNLYAETRDKKVKLYIKNTRKALHMAYSYVIFNKLSITHFKITALKTKLEYKHKRNTIDTVRELQNELNTRIKELLDGAQNELLK